MTTTVQGGGRVATAGMILVLVVGCTSSGDSTTPSTSDASSSVALPTTPPPVTRPLDATAYKDKVCALLADEQAAAHAFPGPGRRSTGSERNECMWGLGRPYLRVTYHDRDMLAGIYRRDPSIWGRVGFLPETIAGQPGARWNIRNAPMDCMVAVGLNDHQGIGVDTALDFEDTDACDRALAIAETIVHNLGG